MKIFLKLFTSAFLSALLFGVCEGIFSMIENYYEISAFDNFVLGFTIGSLVSFLFYLTIGILFFYLNFKVTNKVKPNNPYAFGLFMYSLLGLLVGCALLYSSQAYFYFMDTLYFIGTGLLVSNIFYHVLHLMNVLAKRKAV
ncbi:hypothetical protein ACRC6Q_08455 [Planococcus sp. SE5232]|uniref:hypothetical protein n=1 Tax=unclassified Planococcus (in: firmicutes) TaxID=2662419 RepID=UPI003D6AEB4F